MSLFREWEKVLAITNHTNTKLQITCSEARYIIREELNAINHAGSIRKQSIKKQLILFYKYLYFKVLEVFANEQPFTININHNLVIYDFESFIHLGRHFAQSIKSGKLDKSYFKQDFEPADLHEKLYEIFCHINNSQYPLALKGEGDTQLFFKYKNIQYTLWITKNNDPKSEFKYRVGSFYPATSQDELRKSARLTMVNVTDDLIIFQN